MLAFDQSPRRMAGPQILYAAASAARRSGADETGCVRVFPRMNFGVRISHCGSVTMAVSEQTATAFHLCTGGPEFEGQGLEIQRVRRRRWSLVLALSTGRQLKVWDLQVLGTPQEEGVAVLETVGLSRVQKTRASYGKE
jgi:hypothetical protein